ncbi:hypothetical protein [Alicyclobacillus fodiniaquatilis]|uniref:Uncharacterized protein n=1 Tax=Alicyclobacillus fodiniaquatilis TaxID=1661150 RepID=A0ABW4JPT8_9BACL
MYELEIDEALDEENLELIWELMFKRTAWIQNNEIPIEDVPRLKEETARIKERILVIQGQICRRISEITKSQNASKIYGGWR